MDSYQSLMLPQSVLVQKLSSMQQESRRSQGILATSAKTTYDLSYYVKGALAGGICCAVTHGALWYIFLQFST